MRPTQAHQIVNERFRQVSHFLIGHNGSRTVSFTEARFIGSQNHGNMGKFRDSKTQRLIKQNLARRVIDMVIAADDMGNVHQRVINDHSKVVGRVTIATLNDQIVKLFIIKTNVSFNQIFDNCRACLNATKAHNTARRFCQVFIATSAVVFGLFPYRQSLFSFCFQFFRCAGAIISLAFVD